MVFWLRWESLVLARSEFRIEMSSRENLSNDMLEPYNPGLKISAGPYSAFSRSDISLS